MRTTSLPIRDDEKLSSEGFVGYKGGYQYAFVHPEDPEVEEIAQAVRKGVCLTEDDFDPDGHLVEVLRALGREVDGRDDFSFGFVQGVHDGWELLMPVRERVT